MLCQWRLNRGRIGVAEGQQQGEHGNDEVADCDDQHGAGRRSCSLVSIGNGLLALFPDRLSIGPTSI